MFKKNEIKLLSPFYLHGFIFSLSKVVLAFYTLYFVWIGFSFLEIALLWTVRSIIGMIFEIPTGAIADKYGKKISVILGFLLKWVVLLFIPLSHKFYVIAILMGFDALFETLISGADRAWVVDMLHENDETLTDTYFLRRRFFINIGAVASPMIAWFVVAHFGMSYLWQIFGVWTVLATIFLFFWKNATLYAPKEEKDKSFLIQETKDSFWYILKRKLIIFLFVALFLYFFIEEITGLSWTPFLLQSWIKLDKIGYIFSIISVFGIISPFIIEKVLDYKSKLEILFGTLLVYGLLLSALYFVEMRLFLVVLFVMFSNLEEIFSPIEEALVNSYIKWKNRATILSIRSMVTSLSSIIWWPLAWWLLWVITLRQSLIFSGVLIILLSFLYLKIHKHEKKARLVPV